MVSGGERLVPAFAPRAVQENYGFETMSLEQLQELWRTETADRPGVCVCRVFEDGKRGFTQKCPVHGGRDRGDFARLTALRGEIASRVRAPESARRWGKDGSK